MPTAFPALAATTPEALGHEVLVANPRRLKLIYGQTDKSDRLDAEHLARVGRMDPKLLSAVQHRGAEAQADLALLRSRDALVRTQAQLINHARDSVKSVGDGLESVCDDGHRGMTL